MINLEYLHPLAVADKSIREKFHIIYVDSTRLSKKLSYFLRHHPEDLDLKLDDQGFTTITIQQLADRLNCKSQEIKNVVKQDRKQRFELKDGHIRATYGHSIELGRDIYEEREPLDPVDLPDYFYHGTTRQALPSIQKEGLKPMNRQFVHLSPNKGWAEKVGKRRDANPVILRITTECAINQGVKFWEAGPTTILATAIPNDCIKT